MQRLTAETGFTLRADAREIPLRDRSVQMVCTSPPYWGLRDYGTATWAGGDLGCAHLSRVTREKGEAKASTLGGGKLHLWAAEVAGAQYRGACARCGALRIDRQIGLEASPEEYVQALVEVFAEVRRVLKDDGTLWLVLGDSYASQGGPEPAQTKWQIHGASDGQNGGMSRSPGVLKPKDLCGIPWRVAFALQAKGWYLRSDVIWAKPNPMPESVTDRPTRSHEYLFLLSKNERYYYDADAIREGWADARRGDAGPAVTKYSDSLSAGSRRYAYRYEHNTAPMVPGRNKRDVWTVVTKPTPESHFATFPSALIEPCVLAGSRYGDVVLDPFFGSGTVGEVAERNGRRWVGLELNADYITIARRKTAQRGFQFSDHRERDYMLVPLIDSFEGDF